MTVYDDTGAMRWLLRSRNALGLLFAVGAGLALTIALSHLTAPYPPVGTRSGLAIPASLATPQLTALATLGLLLSANITHEITAVRPLIRYERLALAAIAVTSCLVMTLAAHLTHDDFLYSAARNQLGLTGIGLTARRILSPAPACALPIAYLTIVFCLADRDHPPLWAWPLETPLSLSAATTAAALLLLGAATGLDATSQRRQLHSIDT